MYIMINNVIGEKRIDLSYPIHSFKQRKEIAVISMFSDNVKYEIPKPRMGSFRFTTNQWKTDLK